jgi:hypothetical protein
MGVVRREGDWRLERQQEGVHEITYQKDVQRKVITSDYSSQGFDDQRMEFGVPVDEVESYSDAEQIFERLRDGQGPSTGLGGINGGGVESGERTGTTGENGPGDLPPGGVLLVGVIGGGLFVFQSGFDPQSIVFLVGALLLLLAVGVLGFTYVRYQSGGTEAAFDFLLGEGEQESGRTGGSDSSVERTPPAPESLRNELYFERADGQCEWCEDEVDAPEVHHIQPRSEGGPNEPSNLAVLCPNCHQKADRGVISRSKLRYKISD